MWNFIRLKDSIENLPEIVTFQKSLKKRFEMGMTVKETDFVAFDTELTGLDFRRDSIISIGAVKLRGRRILPSQTFYKLVRPESELRGESVVVHEITHSDLSNADPVKDVLVAFLEFIGDAVLIGHFVHIDIHFVSQAMKKLFGIALRNPTVDTRALHDWLYENDDRFAKHHNGMTTKTDLFSMVKRYGIEAGKAHNALSDAYMTAQLFQRFLPFLSFCGINKIKELIQIGKM